MLACNYQRGFHQLAFDGTATRFSRRSAAVVLLVTVREGAVIDHFALDTYRRDRERRRLAEVAADHLADLAAASRPSARTRFAALLRALAARIEPAPARAALPGARLLLE